MLIAVRPPEAGVMKDSVPDYTLNRNSTISPSSPAEYIPRGPRIEKQPAEVNSAGWQGFVGQNACAAQERRPACGGGHEGRRSRLHVKPEQDDIAVLHDVLLALGAH